MASKKELQDLFGTTDLYAVLSLQVSATSSDIRRAYYRLAKMHHPDKASDERSTQRFQALGKVYNVLCDPEKRKVELFLYKNIYIYIL